MVKAKNLYLNVVMLVVGLNIILNYGFSNLGIRLCSILVPFNELILIWGLARMVLRVIRNNNHININYKIVSLMLLSIFSGFRMLSGFMHYGIFAFRDGTHYLDMLFLWVVWEEMRYSHYNCYYSDDIWDILDIICWFSFLFYCFMKFSITANIISNISPVYIGAQSKLTLLSTTTYIMLWQTIFAVIHAARIGTKKISIWKKRIYQVHIYMVVIIEFTEITKSGGRSTLISLLVITAVLFLIGEKKILIFFNRKIFLVCFLGILMLSLGISQYFNSSFSMDTIVNIVKSIWGKGTYFSKADGTALRLKWWKNIIENNCSNPIYFLFGQGFGKELTDFTAGNGALVREPHNSFISIFGRCGVIGFIIWIKALIVLLKKSVQRYKQYNNLESLFIFTMIIVLCTVAMVETIFEVSYITMPFYVLIAIMIIRQSIVLDINTTM